MTVGVIGAVGSLGATMTRSFGTISEKAKSENLQQQDMEHLQPFIDLIKRYANAQKLAAEIEAEQVGHAASIGNGKIEILFKGLTTNLIVSKETPKEIWRFSKTLLATSGIGTEAVKKGSVTFAGGIGAEAVKKGGVTLASGMGTEAVKNGGVTFVSGIGAEAIKGGVKTFARASGGIISLFTGGYDIYSGLKDRNSTECRDAKEVREIIKKLEKGRDEIIEYQVICLVNRVAALKLQVNDSIKKRDINNMIKLINTDIEPLLAKWGDKKGEHAAIGETINDLKNILEILVHHIAADPFTIHFVLEWSLNKMTLNSFMKELAEVLPMDDDRDDSVSLAKMNSIKTLDSAGRSIIYITFNDIDKKNWQK